MKTSHSSFPFHRSSTSSGFTLIEVMLVVVIILIATGVSVPVFRGAFKSTQMTDAVRSTVRMTRFARSLAILHQADCTLEFKESQIILTCADEPKTMRRLPEDISIETFETQSKTIDAEEPRKVIYYPSGMNDGFELTLTDPKGREKSLTCHPISGKVTVE